MIVLAKGSITKPDALAPYVDDEMRVVGELKGEGVIKLFIGAPPDLGCTSCSRDPASTTYEAEWTPCRLSSRASWPLNTTRSMKSRSGQLLECIPPETLAGLLRRLRQAAHLGDGDEVPKMSQVDGTPMLLRHV
jgi:hypothetical protein